MLSHIVIFRADPALPGGADELIAGANRLLKSFLMYCSFTPCKWSRANDRSWTSPIRSR